MRRVSESGLPGRAGTIAGLLLSIALYALLLTVLCRAALDVVFGIELDNAFFMRDYLGNLVVALLVLALVQSRSRTLLLAGVIIVGFQMCNGLKLAVLGTPISPDDFLNVQNLFYLTDGWRRIALMLVAFLPLILALILIPFRRPSAWATLGTLAVAALLLAQFSAPLRASLDGWVGNSVWNQPENYKRRGLALHIAQETLRTLAKVGKHPDEASVLSATQAMPALPPVLPGNGGDAQLQSSGSKRRSHRNVHVIVLESFFDPTTLGIDWVPEDPFPEDFRALWAQTGHSMALSPVFGGYTANAEFEALCGFPVTENAVFFEGWLRRQVPCLPSVLAGAGYQTITSHPNVAGFWNRTNAYPLIGFEHYLSKADFDLGDSVGGLLLDRSLYDQVLDQLHQLPADRPVFNYMLTYHGHLPYPRSDRYPDKVQGGREAALLHGYLNHLWYKSRDLMHGIDAIRTEDPDALIVAFGDHLPFLGPNYGVYTEAHGLPADRAAFTGDMLEYLVSTPLIVIDGRNGPLNVGKLPLYRLPSLVLDLLGNEGGDGMFDWTANPDGEIIRPIYGMHIAIQDGIATACPDADTVLSTPVASTCESSADWMARTRLLIRDLFTGRQYGLKRIREMQAGVTREDPA